MLTLIMKNMKNNTMYIAQELHTFLSIGVVFKVYKSIHFHQYFHYTLQLIYRLFYFYTYNFCSQGILLCHMIYHIHIHNY